ncbi:MAG: globin domain-containing protein, partial [Alphaproteobacteria bacterium]
MDDLLSEFLTETTESLDVLDVELVKLEQDPNDPELLQNIFRLLHTIKGTCGFLDLPRLEAVAHAGENILGKFRDAELDVTPEAVTLILAALDRIKALLDALAGTGAEPAGDDADLIAQLNAMAEGGNAAAAAEPPAPMDFEAPTSAPAPETSLFDAVGGLSAVDAAVENFYRRVLADDNLRDFFDGVDMDQLQGKQRAFLTMALGGPDAYDGADLTVAHAHLVDSGLDDSHFDAVAGHLGAALEELEVPIETVDRILATVETTRDAVLGRGGAPAVDDSVEPAEEAPAPSAAVVKDAPAGETGSARNAAPQSIRVGVDVLENLMTVVSELVLTRNQVLQILRNQKDSEFAAPLQRLNQVTSELQESVMKTRMQPIGNAWSKIPRLIRDLTHELGKKIDIQMEGAETELDRQVLDLIKDPLTHMVRNSADHGLESPEDRVAAGKSAIGHVKLRAYHEGGHIILEIADDGRGLNIDKIKEKAIINGLASEAELAAMSDKQIQ